VLVPDGSPALAAALITLRATPADGGDPLALSVTLKRGDFLAGAARTLAAVQGARSSDLVSLVPGEDDPTDYDFGDSDDEMPADEDAEPHDHDAPAKPGEAA
jgi:hypothetical protein